jgi:sulfur carrier protein
LIEIQLNQDRMQLDDGCTLAQLIAGMRDAPAALATAVNGDFVPRDRRADRVLQGGDIVTTFEPITGG